MKDIIYSKALKSYKKLKRFTPLLPFIIIISDIIIFIILFSVFITQVPELIVLLLMGVVILGIIGEIVAEHYFNILDTYENFFEYSKYYYQKQSFKALKKQIRKNKKYLI